NLAIERYVLPRDEALKWAEEHGQQFKVELIRDLPPDEEISFYRQGDFTDLCSGPHMQRTGKLGRGFKLMKVAGSYWRGDESREQLQRIYGTAWFSPEDLAAHLERLEEAKKRDHRKLGRELDLFSFHEEAPAMPFFHPRGAFVYNRLVDYARELFEEWGYDEVVTPQILDVDLWHRSGHYANYRDAMYFGTFDENSEGEPDFAEPSVAVKPMNCPTHCLIYGTGKKSYRDLPIRYADFGRLHRYERSGVTAGLLRVRSFAQDDSHIFCRPDQIGAEVTSVTRMILDCYRTFGFEDVRIYLSTRPEKSIGSPELWERAEAALEGALREMGVEFEVQPGEGAFYGPKIDFSVRDALKREWQLGTCQLDFNLPERFDLKFTTQDDTLERPVMVHRAMLGSLERFLGVLIEHTGGDLPLWLAPEQCRVFSITDAQEARVREVVALLRKAGVRAEADVRNEKMGLKVREATLAKVRYQLIIGDRELERGTVAVRHRTDGDLGEMDLESLQALLLQQVRDRV
ncbi:MAG: threonine--tRNA ligase, partial [Planctomycetota bacterium JB042]